jgi:predicted Zn-dependent protease
MNKRLLMLEKMVQSGQADSFARYALALEYKKEGQVERALEAFSALRAHDPSYLPQYLMAGQMLIDADQKDAARAWLEAGLVLARSAGNSHSASELESALAGC